MVLQKAKQALESLNALYYAIEVIGLLAPLLSFASPYFSWLASSEISYT